MAHLRRDLRRLDRFWAAHRNPMSGLAPARGRHALRITPMSAVAAQDLPSAVREPRAMDWTRQPVWASPLRSGPGQGPAASLPFLCKLNDFATFQQVLRLADPIAALRMEPKCTDSILLATLSIQMAWFGHRRAQLKEFFAARVLETGPPTLWTMAPPAGWNAIVTPGSGLRPALPGSFVNHTLVPTWAYL